MTLVYKATTRTVHESRVIVTTRRSGFCIIVSTLNLCKRCSILFANGVLNVSFEEPFYILVSSPSLVQAHISKYLCIAMACNAQPGMIPLREEEISQDKKGDTLKVIFTLESPPGIESVLGKRNLPAHTSRTKIGERRWTATKNAKSGQRQS